MKKLALALVYIFLALTGAVLAQSSPGLYNGQVPTAAEWNSFFAAKQDVLNYTPLNSAGGVMTGKLTTSPTTVSNSGFNLTPGTAPASPNNGDVWVTSSGFYARAAGSTVGPLGVGGSVTSVGTGTGLTGGPVTSTGTISLSTPVAIVNGGTGVAAASVNDILNAILPTQTGNNGKVLSTNGSTSSWITVSGTGTVTSVAAGTGLTASPSPITGSGTLSLTVPVTVPNGGTGLTSGTSGGVPYYASSSTVASSGALSANQIILGGGAGAAPTSLAAGTSSQVAHGGTPPTFSSLAYGDIGASALAAGSDCQANTASKLLTPNASWSCGAVTTLTNAATVLVDMSTGVNFGWTINQTETLGAPSNTKVGQSGVFHVTQDGTGSRTLAYNAVYKWQGGTACVLSTAAGKIDYIFYYVYTSTEILLNCLLDVR